MTVRSRAAKKARRESTRSPHGSNNAAGFNGRSREIDTWILGLQLRALHLEQRHGPDTHEGRYAYGVAVACRQAVKDRYDMISHRLTGGLTTPEAQSGFTDASKLIEGALTLGVPPPGDYSELLQSLFSDSSGAVDESPLAPTSGARRGPPPQ